MRPDDVRHQELHPREADTGGGQAPPAGGGARIGHVQHHVGPCLGDVVEAHILGRDLADALVDDPPAVGAGDRQVLPVMQVMRRRAGAHDGGQAQLPADDGGMRGAPAMIRHDGRGAFHDRHPVGVGDRGDEDRAVDELVDIGGRLDQAGAPGRRRAAHRQTGQDLGARRCHAVILQDMAAFSRLHRLGPGLHDEKLPGDPVLGPFHVHRQAVMFLDGLGHAGEVQHLGIAEREHPPLPLGGGDVARHRLAGLRRRSS
jgi:hypothetical protein